MILPCSNLYDTRRGVRVVRFSFLLSTFSCASKQKQEGGQPWYSNMGFWEYVNNPLESFFDLIHFLPRLPWRARCKDLRLLEPTLAFWRLEICRKCQPSQWILFPGGILLNLVLFLVLDLLNPVPFIASQDNFLLIVLSGFWGYILTGEPFFACYKTFFGLGIIETMNCFSLVHSFLENSEFYVAGLNFNM